MRFNAVWQGETILVTSPNNDNKRSIGYDLLDLERWEDKKLDHYQETDQGL